MAKFERRESELVDLFDTCIDRLMSGETLEAILNDYPESAAELRGLLETGLLVQQVQRTGATSAEIKTAQQQGRDKVVAALGNLPTAEKPKAKPRPRILQWVAMGAAAVLAMGFGITLGVSNTLSMNAANEARNVAMDTGMMLTATALVVEVTHTAEFSLTSTALVNGIAVSPTPVLEFNTATAMPTMLSPTSGADGSEVSVTEMFMPRNTATPAPTTTTTPSAGGVNVGNVLGTATALAEAIPGRELEATSAPVGTSAGLPDTGGGGDASSPVILPTSVDTFYAMTPTLPPPFTPAPEFGADEGAPSSVTTDDRERDEEDKDFGETSGASLPPVSMTGESAMPTAPAPMQPDYNNVQLQPLKAGEIDDNADWDTYMEYRRNYLAMFSGIYGYGVIDIDVSDRQFIKVVDAAGKPVLGAQVQVFAGERQLSNTMTYATGLTLFFPNADPAYERLDNFRVIVTKNGVSTDVWLDINRLDDTLTITLN